MIAAERKPARQAAAGDYHVVSYAPGYKDQILQLQTLLWSPDLAQNRAYFAWKHERNPYVDRPLMYLALHDEVVVGMRSFFGVRWEAGPEPERLTGLYADDMVVAPEHRDRGLIPLIMRAAFSDLSERGYNYIFSLSAGAATFMSSLSMGWKNVGPMRPVWHRSWSTTLRHRASRLLAHVGAGTERYSRPLALTELDRSSIHHRGAPASISFAFEPRLDDMAALVARRGHDGRIRQVRDRTYLAWRFANPFSRYGFLFDDADRLDGYLVVQESTSPYADRRRLNIVDWEGANAQVLERLFRAANRLASACRRPLVVWSATLSGEQQKLLDDGGFRAFATAPGPERHVPALLVRQVGRDSGSEWTLGGNAMLDSSRWDLRMLYSMHG